MKSTKYHYTYNKNVPPLMKIESGETVVVETEDAFRGLIKKEEDVTPENIQNILDLSCPLSGPIYIKNSKPGDWLEIHINNIEVEDYGVLVYGNGFTCLPEILTDWTTAVAKVQNNFIYFTDEIKFPVKPIMIGTIGTTPNWGITRSPLQGIWGVIWIAL